MSDDDESPIKEKIFATPESKDKTSSKFKNILDDIELKMPKPKSYIKKADDDSTNSKLDTNNSISNNKDSIKDPKNKNQLNNKENNIKLNQKSIRKFNSFEEGSLKKGNKKENNQNAKSNENIEKNQNKIKTKKFKKLNSFNTNTSSTSSTGNLYIKLNHDNRFNRKDLMITPKNNSKNNTYNNNNNSKNKKEKLRPSTPGIRTSEINTTSKNNNNNKAKQNTNMNINKNTPNINNINNKIKKIPSSNKISKIDIDPLYIPHIVKDPLDILRHQVDLILEQSNEDVSNLSNKISLIDMEMESSFAKIHENYAKDLQDIYIEKELKLREINKKYDYALYKMLKTYGDENNIIYDEMKKDKEEQIFEIEQDFNAKKNKIKNNLNLKIDEVKKLYEKKRQEQDISNSNILKEIKKKIYNILYEENKKNENKNSTNDNKSLRKKKAVSMGRK